MISSSERESTAMGPLSRPSSSYSHSVTPASVPANWISEVIIFPVSKLISLKSFLSIIFGKCLLKNFFDIVWCVCVFEKAAYRMKDVHDRIVTVPQLTQSDLICHSYTISMTFLCFMLSKTSIYLLTTKQDLSHHLSLSWSLRPVDIPPWQPCSWHLLWTRMSTRLVKALDSREVPHFGITVGLQKQLMVYRHTV